MDMGLALQPEMNIPSSGITPFVTPASFGKARRRVEKVLPKSPRKRVAVVQKLATDVLKIKLPAASTNNHGNRELEQTIINYYESDEISRVMPGKADVMTIWHKNGTKSKMQKRHLYTTVGETFQMFKADNPGCAVGISKFASYVLLTSKLPQNVCGCKYHNNAIPTDQMTLIKLPTEELLGCSRFYGHRQGQPTSVKIKRSLNAAFNCLPARPKRKACRPSRFD
jgi:hypothetical protein